MATEQTSLLDQLAAEAGVEPARLQKALALVAAAPEGASPRPKRAQDGGPLSTVVITQTALPTMKVRRRADGVECIINTADFDVTHYEARGRERERLDEPVIGPPKVSDHSPDALSLMPLDDLVNLPEYGHLEAGKSYNNKDELVAAILMVRSRLVKAAGD